MIGKTMPFLKESGICVIVLLLLSCHPANAQWNYDIPFPEPLDKGADTVFVTFIGDVMMHSRQLEYDYREFFREMKEITLDADISVANMEFTLAGEPYSGYPAFSSPDGYAGYAADCGIDVFLTANNHILDKGRGGLKRTLKIYERMRDTHGTHYTGTALDKNADTLVNPLVIVGKGVRIALVNFSYGTNSDCGGEWPAVKLMEKESVSDMISRARARKADFIVALPHWGTEYRLKHSREQEEWAEWLVSQGVDLIVGAHPHVVQDTTHINGVPVIYSLGNAISNMSAENTRLELAVRAGFVTDQDGTKKMLEPELIFLWCSLPGNLRDTYTTIPVKDFIGRREEWLQPSDYDNMTATLKRVIKETGIYEENCQAGSR